MSPIELSLSEMAAIASEAVFAGTATELDYRLIAASDALSSLGTAGLTDLDNLMATANDAIAAANQALVESINLSFSDSFEFLDSLTLVPA